jgi:hypothetical protein
MAKTKERFEEINLLDLIPGRRLKWEMEGETVVLLYPKFRNRFLAQCVLPRMKFPNWRIKLDEIGSWVWLHCDGHSTVRELAEGMREQFGEKVEPVYDRLSLFLKKLESDKFIQYENLPPRIEKK